MPNVTAHVYLELEVEVSFARQSPDPDVGINQSYYDDFQIESIKGFIPKLQLRRGKMGHLSSTAGEITLAPQLDFSDEMAAEIEKQCQDEIYEAIDNMEG